MSEWRNTTLGQLGSLFDGPHATPTRIDSGPYFLNIASLENGRLDLSTSDHVSEDDFARWTKRVTPRGGDLLFSYETRLGQAALMPNNVRACLGRRMALLRPAPNVIEPRFLLYLYLGPNMQKTIELNTIHGATVNRIPLNRMGRWEIAIPDLSEQQAIAEVLGALDDKIAANTALAATVDEALRKSFDQALTQFTVDESTLGSIASVVLGGTPSRAEPRYWTDGTIPWLNSGAANATRIITPSEMITNEALARSAAKLMPRGATVIAITGATLGQVARLEIESAGNQSLVGVSSSDGSLNDWLYLAIRHRIEDLLTRATGAAQQHVSKGDVAELQVPVPSDADRRKFSAVASPLLQVAANAEFESRTLAATRDALLPQLLSGKLRVHDAEKLVSEAGV